MVSAKMEACLPYTQYFLPRGHIIRIISCITTTRTFRITRTTPKDCLILHWKRSNWSGATRNFRRGWLSSKRKPKPSSSLWWPIRRTNHCGVTSTRVVPSGRRQHQASWSRSERAPTPVRRCPKKPAISIIMLEVFLRLDLHNSCPSIRESEWITTIRFVFISFWKINYEAHQNCLNEISFGCSQIISVDRLFFDLYFYF